VLTKKCSVEVAHPRAKGFGLGFLKGRYTTWRDLDVADEDVPVKPPENHAGLSFRSLE
jgi:hypothetical protein